MDIEDRLDILLNAAAELGIDVRREAMGGDAGGLCLLRGRRVLFVDISADPVTRYEKTVEAIAGLPGLQDRYFPPEIREDLERAAGR